MKKLKTLTYQGLCYLIPTIKLNVVKIYLYRMFYMKMVKVTKTFVTVAFFVTT